MSIATRAVPAEPDLDGLPPDRLYRLSPEQFRIAREVGAFPEVDRVELVDGLLRRGGPAGPFYPLTLDQFHRMDEVLGLERVELLGGWLVARTPILLPHRTATFQTREFLARIAPPGYYVDQGAPTSLPHTDTEPLPEVLMIRGSSRDYSVRHPGPDDIVLLVEVSDSTLSSDRNYKWRLYAREGISTYWIVNLVALRLEVFTDPSGPSDEPGYRHQQNYGPEDEVPLILDGREVGRIAVRDLLP